ncbi:glycosyltransferase [Halobacillus litoralis]|uniref:glycosyltransferase n=1 Tax=Halobacillus litoralis TaxID=45668 RepID=UPI001CD68D6B|nr:glycosyltransferase [Halobacillus litoralis]MCA0970176.1 glycosyltransferase [Halobacillus litoralis]
MFWLYVILALFWMVVLVDYWLGYRKIPSLTSMSSLPSDEKLSVIIAAKDEEKDIEATIRSLAGQENVNVEIIAVNDRSDDRTGERMERLAGEFPQVQSFTIKALPDGWLGKNHALHFGVKQATGDYFVFTDADIIFQKNALSKAFTFLKKEKADHVTAAPDLNGESFWLRGLISFFLLGFGYLKRPWQANQDNKKGGMGIGAFNLISRTCYEQIGGHEAIRLRPDDDLELGQRVKRFGFRQRLVSALDDMTVEWYPSLKAALIGFEKNAFAGLNYSVLLALTAVVGVFISQVLPYLLLIISPLEIQIISAVNIVLLCCLYALTIHSLTTYSMWYILALPIFALLFVYMLSRALLLTWIRGGIEWRGSRYSLKELKQHFKHSEED